MDLSDIYSLIAIIAILVAGAWTLYRFGLGREMYPKLEFDLGMNQLGESRGKNIVELVARISNKGIARQKIKDFTFNLLYFEDETPFDLSDEHIQKRLKFNKLLNALHWDNPDHEPFVDGGVTLQFSYVTALDKNIRFVMIYSKFKQERYVWFSKTLEVNHITRTFAIEDTKH